MIDCPGIVMARNEIDTVVEYMRRRGTRQHMDAARRILLGYSRFVGRGGPDVGGRRRL